MLVPGRTGSQCRYRWLSDQARKAKKMPWSEKEDILLRNIVNKEGSKPWTLVAQELNKVSPGVERTGKQCRERWRNHLDPGITKYPWISIKHLIGTHGRMRRT